MQIRHVLIKRFRGIKHLDWSLSSSTICLIGPNDSRKSTILDAIEYTLSSRWNIPFSDEDFFEVNTEEPIEIQITVGELPDKLITLDKFGGHLRGWHNNTKLVDEPNNEGDEEVLTVQLTVDQSLEPQWNIITDRTPAGIPIASKDRALFHVSRLSSYVDRDLTWSRGSALSRATGEIDTLSKTLAEINRSAKQAFNAANLDELEKALEHVSSVASQFGVKAEIELRPAIDAQIGLGTGALAIHDGNVPARQMGLGSRRLLTAAIQKSTTKTGSILLVDEIEHGLEPHRLRQFIRLIRAGDKNNQQLPYISQTIAVTHSTVAICEQKATEICVVRANKGVTSVQQIADNLQSLVRGLPEAFLARKIIVCEGKTEVGLLRAFDAKWSKDNDGIGFTFQGYCP